MSEGFLLVLSGPSGSGKDTVINQLLKRDSQIVCSVSMTTRAPRPGEQDGVNYFFVSKEQFEENIAREEMLEWAKYGENYYGTPKSPILQWIAEGKTVILNIEVQGAGKIKEKMPEVRTMFLMPPSVQALRARLKGRGTESEEEIEKRIAIARYEISHAYDYDYIIVNNRLEDAVEGVLEVVNRNRAMLRGEAINNSYLFE